LILTKEENSKIKDFYFEKLEFCGCGNPEATLIFIRNLLNIRKERSDTYSSLLPEYIQWRKDSELNLINVFEFKDNPDKPGELTEIQDSIIQYMLYHLNSLGIFEHGSSINSCWLTAYGYEILDILNKLGDIEDFDISNWDYEEDDV